MEADRDHFAEAMAEIRESMIVGTVDKTLYVEKWTPFFGPDAKVMFCSR